MQLESTRMNVCGIDTEVFTRGEGRPLLYLHDGLGLDPDSAFLRMLAENFRVSAPSHPGFGGTPRPNDFKTVEDLAYFYLDLMDQLKLDEVTLVGASFGGWIASEIAVRSTARLRELVLIDTVGARFADRDQVDIKDIYMVSDAEFLELAFHDPEKGRLDIAAKTDEELVIVSRNRVALCQYGWSPYMNNPRLKRWLHRINVPTLLLWGKQDNIVDTSYGLQFASRIAGAQFRVIDNAGHFPAIEQPGATSASIREFSCALAPA